MPAYLIPRLFVLMAPDMAGNDMVQDGFALAALACAAGRPASEVAKLAGVSERTIRRWNNRPSFVGLVSRLRDSMLSDAMGRLLAMNSEALEALRQLLSSTNDSVRLGAVGRILDSTLRTRHALHVEGELRGRLDELEKLVKEVMHREQDLESDREGDRAGPSDGRAAEGSSPDTEADGRAV
jgi:hypothetical protein